MSFKTCYYCKHFQSNPDKKYYSHCLRDKKNHFEIQSMYAQFCRDWETKNNGDDYNETLI